MANSRRIARELALKVLFQVDVGKQPLSEVLETAMKQAMMEVIHPIEQVIRDAQKAAADETLRQAPAGNTSSGRRIRNAGRAISLELKVLEERLSERASAIPKRGAQYEAEEASADVAELLDAVKTAIHGIRRKYESDSKAVDTIIECCFPILDRLTDIYASHVPAAHVTAILLSKLVHGVMERSKSIDKRVRAISEGWSLERQPAVDRNILRLGVFELIHMADIPSAVTINEAVELAKKYSTDESGQFINGVLGALVGENAIAS